MILGIIKRCNSACLACQHTRQHWIQHLRTPPLPLQLLCTAAPPPVPPSLTWSVPLSELLTGHCKPEALLRQASQSQACAAPHVHCPCVSPLHHLHDGHALRHTARKHSQAVQGGTRRHNTWAHTHTARSIQHSRQRDGGLVTVCEQLRQKSSMQGKITRLLVLLSAIRYVLGALIGTQPPDPL